MGISWWGWLSLVKLFKMLYYERVKEEAGIDVEITGFIGLCKNVEKDVVNIDFVCKAVDGQLTTSEESSEVLWVNREDALRMVTFPLTRKVSKYAF